MFVRFLLRRSIVAVLLVMPLNGLAAEAPPDRLELVALLERGAFETLEARLSAYQEGLEAGRISEDAVGHAFDAFAYSDPAFKAKLDAWNERFPESYAAALARGRYYLRLGWHSRGGRYSKHTDDQRFADMRKHFARSERDLVRAIELNQKLSYAYALLINLAMADRGDGQRDETLRRGLSAVPRSSVIRYFYLRSLVPWWGGSVRQIEAFITDMQRSPDYHAGLKSLEGFAELAMAGRLVRDRKRDEAVAYFDRALAHGEHWRFYYLRGQNFYFLKRYDEGLKDLDRALELNPQATFILARRARLHDKAGRPEQAYADWDLSLRLDPFQPKVLEQRSYALKRDKRYQEALTDLDRALVYGADDPGVRDARGRLFLYGLKDYAASVREMARATQLAPNKSRHWYYYSVGLHHLRDCRMAAALTTYRNLCESGGDCQESRLDWARKSLDYLVGNGICPGG